MRIRTLIRTSGRPWMVKPGEEDQVKMGSAHVSAVIVGCAVAIATPATGAQKAPLPSETAAPHTEQARTITVRQVFAYGRQNTWVAGVKLTESGAASYGRAKKLRSRLGGWSCERGWAEQGNRFHLEMTALNGTSCNVGSVAVPSLLPPRTGRAW